MFVCVCLYVKGYLFLLYMGFRFLLLTETRPQRIRITLRRIKRDRTRTGTAVGRPGLVVDREREKHENWEGGAYGVRLGRVWLPGKRV